MAGDKGKRGRNDPRSAGAGNDSQAIPFSQRMRKAFTTAAALARQQGDEAQAEEIDRAYEVWRQHGGPKRSPRGQVVAAVDALLMAEAGGESVGAFALLTQQLTPSLYDPPPHNLASATESWSPRDYARFLALGMALPKNPDALGSRQVALLTMAASDLLTSEEASDVRIPTTPQRLRLVLQRARALLEDDRDELPYTYTVVTDILGRNPGKKAEKGAATLAKPEREGGDEESEVGGTGTGDWIKAGLVGLLAAVGLAKKLDSELGLRNLLTGEDSDID